MSSVAPRQVRPAAHWRPLKVSQCGAVSPNYTTCNHSISTYTLVIKLYHLRLLSTFAAISLVYANGWICLQ